MSAHGATQSRENGIAVPCKNNFGIWTVSSHFFLPLNSGNEGNKELSVFAFTK
jgi:hypothetical protein